MAEILKSGLNRYVGNTHMHTTRSDGGLKLDEAVGLYADEGYDFVAVTDHWAYLEEDWDHDILRLSGAEYDCMTPDGLECIHIVAAGTERDPEISREDGVQERIDKINAAGGLAILAHPAWSMQSIGTVLPLKGISATEIYNSVSGLPMNCRPDSSLFSDMLSARGMFIPTVAADDSHPYTFEAAKSYIVVFAEKLERENIVNAVKNGDFYASQGPDFLSVKIEDDTLIVDCSPVSCAVFYDNLPWNDVRSITGENIKHFERKLLDAETFIRVELIDARGDRAWLPPIDLSQYR